MQGEALQNADIGAVKACSDEYRRLVDEYGEDQANKILLDAQ